MNEEPDPPPMLSYATPPRKKRPLTAIQTIVAVVLLGILAGGVGLIGMVIATAVMEFRRDGTIRDPLGYVAGFAFGSVIAAAARIAFSELLRTRKL